VASGLEQNTPTGADVFVLLGDEHRRLDGIFLSHQESVLMGDWEGAAATLAEYKALLAHHMKVEDEEVLPVYNVRVGEVPGGSAEVFRLEHRRIEKLLGEVERRLQETSQKPTRRGTISFLDFEKMFKDYIEHHDLRERNILYPKCQESFSAAERESVRRSWEQPSPQHRGG